MINVHALPGENQSNNTRNCLDTTLTRESTCMQINLEFCQLVNTNYDYRLTMDGTRLFSILFIGRSRLKKNECLRPSECKA